MESNRSKAAIYAVTSPSLSPYILNIPIPSSLHSQSSLLCGYLNDAETQTTCHQPIKDIQLKNDLHHITMGGRIMQHYLSDVKTKIDAIAAVGQPLPE